MRGLDPIPARFPAEWTDPLAASTSELARRLTDAPYRRFAVFGDSLSAGTGDPSPGYESLGWPDRVARALHGAHPAAEYLNTAVVGATTAGALRHQSAAVTAFGPDLLHVPSGANDIAVVEPDFARIADDLRAAYELGRSTGARLVTFTLARAYDLPRLPDFTARVRRLDDLIRALAEEYAVTLVDMWDHPVNRRPDLLSRDGIHFASAGHAVLATEVVDAVVGAAATDQWSGSRG